ncbi:MAG: sulfurtransferase TusA family protein [Nitrospirae bacterium]|nr:sulfurtransferase TusA family protein [Nitrospirota bacterium]
MNQSTEEKTAEIPQHILDEISSFETEIGRLRRKEMPEEKFKKFRLQNGIYGQRQKDDFMVRVKVPQGVLNPEHLKLLANIGDNFSNGIAHATSRQDIQFHFVKLENVPTIMRSLAEAGLTTREACGNTIRNVTACYLSGICPDEIFDVSTYSRQTTDYFLRNPVCQSLPRKFKISFSGCSKDCALAPINDIGAVAVQKEINGTTQRGFKIFIAGGLGPHPRVAQLFEEFVPADDLLPLAESILRVFDQYGERKNRNRARMKFLLEKIGFDELKHRIEEEFKIVKASEKWSYTLPPEDMPGSLPLTVEDREQRLASFEFTEPPGNGDPYFHRWRATNVIPQKQTGYCIVHIGLQLGDITTDQLRTLSDITAKYSYGRIRVTHQQNLLMRWVRNESLYALYKELKAAEMAQAGVGRMMDIQSCPGAETCNLGLTSSRQLARAIGLELSTRDDAEVENVKIKVSGCPNSCGHHHISDIGFHGVAKKLEGRLVPHYQLHLGGGVGNGRAVIGDSDIKLPARNIPSAVSQLVSVYQRDRIDSEQFYQFLDRVGVEYIHNILDKYTSIPSFAEAPEKYSDWGSSSEFVVKLGAGECAGGVVDIIEDFLAAGSREAYKAAMLFEAGENEQSVEWLNRSVLSVARGMLVPFGIDTEVESEIIREFQDKIIDKCIVSDKVEPLFEDYSKKVTKERLSEYVNLAKVLAEESQEAYRQIDASFKFKKREKEDRPEEVKKDMDKKIDEYLDLKGVACPYNFVKTKLKLEEMDAGQTLQIIIDEGEPYKNVPRSVINEGHTILEEEKIEDKHYRIVIEKT